MIQLFSYKFELILMLCVATYILLNMVVYYCVLAHHLILSNHYYTHDTRSSNND
nr:MAG TPA: hypothetical protein [Caudoviricetes sp.]